jgi:hypothetical protein
MTGTVGRWYRSAAGSARTPPGRAARPHDGRHLALAPEPVADRSGSSSSSGGPASKGRSGCLTSLQWAELGDARRLAASLDGPPLGQRDEPPADYIIGRVTGALLNMLAIIDSLTK